VKHLHVGQLREFEDPAAAKLQPTPPAQTREFPLAGAQVGGLTVGKDIPNLGSIRASVPEGQVLKGIRELPMSAFSGPETIFYAANDVARAKKLAEVIKANGRIDPLIIVVEPAGPYILEGAHRFVALHHLGLKSFPALVVNDPEAEPVQEAAVEDPMPGKWWHPA
jgi:hypothetical protein